MQLSTERHVSMGTPALPPTPHAFRTSWLRAAGTLVFVSLTLQHGFSLHRVANLVLNCLNVLLAAFFTADLILSWVRSGRRRKDLALRRFEYVLLGVFLVLLAVSAALSPEVAGQLVGFLHLESRAILLFDLVKLFLLLLLCVQLLRATARLFGKAVRPELILAGSFATLILVGTFLLLLPNATASDRAGLSIVDAFFTATSATCVTGLMVRDIAADFSRFGQMVVLGLLQVGGLGIITFVAFLSAFSMRSLPVPQMMAFRQIVNASSQSDLRRQLLGIIAAVAIIEGLGALLLFEFLPADHGDVLQRIYWSVFHSVSAFCNAGIALEPDGIASLRGNAGISLTLMSLVILGGLGFLVMFELLHYRLTHIRPLRRFAFFRRLHAGQPLARLTLQTKIAVTMMIALLVIGTIGFWLLEWRNTLRECDAGESWMVAAFYSAISRTAGFSAVPVGQLRDATLLLLMVLMMIGANPVSTGGGIKTVSFGILLLALKAMVARRDRIEAFGRTIPGRTLFAALSVFVLYIATAVAAMFLLALTDPDLSFRNWTFEVIGGLSTVGFSTGITPELSAPGKLVLCILMFIGRVGPISLVLSVFQSGHALDYEFPEEEVVVG